MEKIKMFNNNFQRMIWAPGTELEVILLFGMLLPYLEEDFLIEECHNQFPDLIIKTKDGQEIRAEFELFSSHFKEHKHNPNQCELIICWKNNWPECPSNIKVIELSKEIEKLKFSIIKNPNEYKYKKTLWDEVSFFSQVPPNHLKLIRELHDFCLNLGLRIEYGKGDKIPSFTVHLISENAPSKAFLGVYSNGKIWPLFGEDLLTKQVALQFKNIFKRISRLEKTIDDKKWIEFILSNESELQIVKDAISWIASLDWKLIRGS